MSSIDLLIKNASKAISSNKLIPDEYGNFAGELNKFLAVKNGFELFEGGLRFFPWDISFDRNILSWNRFISRMVQKELFFLLIIYWVRVFVFIIVR